MSFKERRIGREIGEAVDREGGILNPLTITHDRPLKKEDYPLLPRPKCALGFCKELAARTRGGKKWKKYCTLHEGWYSNYTSTFHKAEGESDD